MASRSTLFRPSTSRNTHKPIVASPLSYSITPDTVTNPDRAKSPEILRVLSPLRARRTPVLVNAPDVRWRLAPTSRLLRGTASLDSVVSSGSSCSAASTASEVSTVRPYKIAPQDIALPVSSASSVLTALLDEEGAELPVPLEARVSQVGGDLLADQETDDHEERGLCDEAHGRDEDVTVPASWAGEEYVYRSHPLSPVMEVRSTTTTSKCSSIRSLEAISNANIDGDESAQHVPLPDPRRAGIYIRRDNNFARGQNSLSSGTVDAEKEALLASEGKQGKKGRRGFCGRAVKVKKTVKQFGAKIVRGATTRVVAWVLARAM